MKFLKAFYITGFTSIIVIIFSFFTNVIITRYLGPEGRGNYSIVSNLILILTLVLGEGIRRSNVIIVGNKSAQVHETLKKNLFYFILIIIPTYILFFKYSFAIEKILKVNHNFIFIGITAAVLSILWKGFQAIFLGVQDYKNYNLVQIIYTLGIFIINISIVYIFDTGLESILNTFIIVSLIIVIYEFILLNWKQKKSFEKTITNNKKHLILKATISSIFVFIMLRGDIFYLNFFSDINTTGIYSITKVFIDLFQKLPFILGPIIIARSASLKIENEIQNISKLSRVLIIVNAFAIVITFFLGDYIIKLLFTNRFIDSYNYLIYILPSMLFFSSGHIINAFLMGQGFPNIVVYNSVFFGIINFLLNIFFIPKFGVIATPIISSVTFGFWSLVYIIYFAREYKFSVYDLILIRKSDIVYILKFGK